MTAKQKRVLFLMSDTGGGHRAAADAIRAALDSRHPGRYSFALVDVYRRYTPFPTRYMPELYPRWVRWAAASWGFSYHFANNDERGRLVMNVLHRLWGRGLRRLAVEHPADVVVPVHALFPRPVMRAYQDTQPYRPPFVTVVTDLVSTHAYWYEKEVERCLLPTQAAYDRARTFGLRPEQLRVTGLPVHPDFIKGLLSKEEARRRLGWEADRPTVLLLGGGDGMGPVGPIARAIDARGLPLQLVIITGRNRRLQRRLENTVWRQPTRVYPFVTNMPELMAAADMLVTKAGPATISEACIAGLPLILSGAIPGQEAGNVHHVLAHGAGVFAPAPEQVAQTVATWLAEGAGQLAERSARAQALARPDAVFDIAEEIHQQAQRAPVRTRFAAARSMRPALDHAPEDGWLI